MNSSVIEAIDRQKTTNLYDASKSIPDDETRELVRLATFSPTAFHLQNWRFIAVRSPEAKARLRAVAVDQPKVGGTAKLMAKGLNLRPRLGTERRRAP